MIILNEYYIKHIPTDIIICPNQIENVSYETIMNGFNDLNKIDQEIIIRVVFIDNSGTLRIIEDNANKFTFYSPNEIINENSFDKSSSIVIQ